MENIYSDKNVLAAIKQNWKALQFADISLKKDKDVVLAAIKQNWKALQFADISLKKDKDVVLIAVRKHGKALQFADKILKNDKDVVLAAVKQDGFWCKEKIPISPLGFASKSMKNDREVVLAAVRNDNWGMAYPDRRVYQDSLSEYYNGETFLEIIKSIFENCRSELQVRHVTEGSALGFADKNLRNDKEIVIASIRENGLTLKYASDNLRENKEIVKIAVGENGLALKFANKDLQIDEEIQKLAILSVPDVLNILMIKPYNQMDKVSSAMPN